MLRMLCLPEGLDPTTCQNGATVFHRNSQIGLVLATGHGSICSVRNVSTVVTVVRIRKISPPREAREPDERLHNIAKSRSAVCSIANRHSPVQAIGSVEPVRPTASAVETRKCLGTRPRATLPLSRRTNDMMERKKKKTHISRQGQHRISSPWQPWPQWRPTEGPRFVRYAAGEAFDASSLVFLLFVFASKSAGCGDPDRLGNGELRNPLNWVAGQDLNLCRV
ncbi:hypothetical protein B0H67DRAFT_579823 [Lasiosphaeris hirsuta]|uniref:Uncharacterized protein n=1 Tax=Lasiosphaeris hirsuta TaxID=260670 RepID=A0AA40AFZ4_9PEZI|nr:hypothetical protein B0H67DRAFT_579823 [Lasiosphaeris hirsuta]